MARQSTCRSRPESLASSMQVWSRWANKMAPEPSDPNFVAPASCQPPKSSKETCKSDLEFGLPESDSSSSLFFGLENMDAEPTTSSSPTHQNEAKKYGLNRHFVAFECPTGVKYSKLSETLRLKCLGKKVNIQKISRGFSSRNISAVLLETATKSELEALKKALPDWKEPKDVPSQPNLANMVVILNRSKDLPSKAFFISALSEFGKMATIKQIAPNNLLATYEDPKCARACLQAGGIMVQGKRYQVRPLIPKGTDVPKPTNLTAWIHNLPAYIMDHHLTDLMVDIKANHWSVIKHKNQQGQAVAWARVSFLSQNQLEKALQTPIAFGHRQLVWSSSQICASCHQANHVSRNCPLASSNLPVGVPTRPKISNEISILLQEPPAQAFRLVPSATQSHIQEEGRQTTAMQPHSSPLSFKMAATTSPAPRLKAKATNTQTTGNIQQPDFNQAITIIANKFSMVLENQMKMVQSLLENQERGSWEL